MSTQCNESVDFSASYGTYEDQGKENCDVQPVTRANDTETGNGMVDNDMTSGFEYVKSLEQAVEAKEEGNVFFRNKEYDDALESYSKAITFCPEDDEHKETLATLYGNRSAAYFSLEEYELVVEDCTAALALKSDYVKVIARRMLANEKLEKYEDALTGMFLID